MGLEFVGIKLELEDELGRKINLSYLETRYPDLPEDYSKEDAGNFIEMGKGILKWIEENL